MKRDISVECAMQDVLRAFRDRVAEHSDGMTATRVAVLVSDMTNALLLIDSFYEDSNQKTQ